MTNRKELFAIVKKSKSEQKSVGFVPTMGALHEGHGALIKQAKAENDFVVVSVFVNPTQFNQKEDFEKYPRNLEKDIAFAMSCGADFVFTPEVEEIYPKNSGKYSVVESGLSEKACGEFRPGHFSGMLTVVLKLLNLVKANKAYFGEKDFQQVLLVQGMAKEFFLDTEIIVCTTIREESGLAMSSRNQRLSESGKVLASKAISVLKNSVSAEQTKIKLQDLNLNPEYVEDWTEHKRRLAAFWVEDVRLIDNVEVNL